MSNNFPNKYKTKIKISQIIKERKNKRNAINV